MDVLYLIAATAALLWAQSVLLRRFGLKRLTYSRAFSTRAAFVGETVEMMEIIRNEKLLPVPWLRAESRMSPHLRFGAGAREDELHEISGEAYHRSAFFLSPYSQVTRTHQVTLKKRGRYEVGSVALTAGDLFGMSLSTAQIDTRAGITVYPRLLSPGDLDLPSSRWQGDLAVKRWIAPDPFLIAGIREGRPGDPLRDVHWAATARTGRLQVKAHDYTASPKLLVILNVQMDEHQWSDLMDYEQGPIEHGISLAATVCLRALQNGLEAGFCANAPMGEDETQPTALYPARYAGRDTELLEALARLKIVRAKNFPTFLDDIGEITGMDILILSAYDSPLIRQRVAAFRLRGNSVALWPLQKEAA